MNRYLLVSKRGVEIEVLGPYVSDDARALAALALHGVGTIRDEDSVHWIDVEGTIAEAGDFASGFFGEG